MKKINYKYILAPIILLLLWKVSSVIINKPILPGPIESFKTFAYLLVRGELNKHIFISLYRILSGIGFAILFAFPIGILMGYYKKINEWLGPIFYILYPLPKVVFLPIIIILLGIGDLPKIFLISLILFLQLTIVIKDSAQRIPKSQSLAMKSVNANFMQTLWHLIIPSSLPGIMTSIRASLGTAIAILFIAETFAGFDGLGYYIMNQMDIRNYLNMYSGIIMLSIMGTTIYMLIDILEAKICKGN